MNALAGLEQRRNAVLAAMSVLADCASGSYVAFNPHKAKGESKALYDGEREVDEGLYHHWRERFDVDWPDVPEGEELTDEAYEWCYDRAYKLVLQAEADLAMRRGEIVTSVSPIDGADERDKRIIKQYEGKPPIEVAILERCSVPSVKTVRRMYGRDPMTGVRR